MAKTAAWQRKEGKSASGGLNRKGVASYRAANPGSKLKTAVTTKIVGSQIYHTCWITQKNSTPLKNPRNNGGSPIGVNAPPILLTKKIKNIMW